MDINTFNWSKYTRNEIKQISKTWSKVFSWQALRQMQKDISAVNLNGLSCDETDAYKNQWQAVKWAMDNKLINSDWR